MDIELLDYPKEVEVFQQVILTFQPINVIHTKINK